MLKLPRWILTDKYPAFYDSESMTVLEASSRLYGVVNEVVSEYNNFIEKVEKEINDYYVSDSKEFDVFKTALRQEFQDFIDVVNLKVKGQDNSINNMIEYVKNNTKVFVEDIIAEMKTSGELDTAIFNALDNINTAITEFTTSINSSLNDFMLETETFKNEVTASNNEYKSSVEEYKNSIDTSFEEFKTNLAEGNADFKAGLEEEITARVGEFTESNDAFKVSNSKIIQAIRAKILALSGGVRNILLELNKNRQNHTCRVSAVTDEYVTIGVNGGDLNRGLRFWTAPGEAKSFEVTMLSGSAIGRTSLYSGTSTTKTINYLFIDGDMYTEDQFAADSNLLKNILHLNREFRQLVICYTSGEITVTQTFTPDDLNICESSETATLVTALMTGTYIKERAKHHNTCKLFTMGAGDVPYFEKVAAFSNCVIKNISYKGGFR